MHHPICASRLIKNKKILENLAESRPNSVRLLAAFWHLLHALLLHLLGQVAAQKP